MDTDQHGFTHKALTERIIGAFYDVYNELGYGFLESVYHNALFYELRQRGIAAQREVSIPVHYRGILVGEFRADLVVENAIVLELKAASQIERSHEAQLLNYLKATDFEIGFLFNFGPKAAFRRLVFDNPRKQIRVYPCASVADTCL
ncbi:MAG: GxxExxY protein [Acidobacteriaceae bacterium]